MVNHWGTPDWSRAPVDLRGQKTSVGPVTSGVHLLDRQVRDAHSVRMAPRMILSCPTSLWPRDSDRHSTARNQRNAQRAALGFRRDIRPAVGEAKEVYLSSEPAAARDPYRMSISLSTAAASKIARRSAPSGVRYRFRRPAS